MAAMTTGYIKTTEWEARALSARNKVWWPAWYRIRDMCGDVDPNTIEFSAMSRWRAALEKKHGRGVTHKTLRVWRSLWTIMQGMKIAYGTDPSRGVRNRAPDPRYQRWTEGEAVLLVKAAWRHGYRGLACIIATAWDTQFSPVDVRTLQERHLAYVRNLPSEFDALLHRLPLGLGVATRDCRDRPILDAIGPSSSLYEAVNRIHGAIAVAERNAATRDVEHVVFRKKAHRVQRDLISFVFCDKAENSQFNCISVAKWARLDERLGRSHRIYDGFDAAGQHTNPNPFATHMFTMNKSGETRAAVYCADHLSAREMASPCWQEYP
jgi:hypothetical protein